MAGRTIELKVDASEVLERIPQIKEAFAKAEQFDRIKTMLTEPDARHLSWKDAYIHICDLVRIVNEATN